LAPATADEEHPFLARNSILDPAGTLRAPDRAEIQTSQRADEGIVWQG
jgi:hypothetical protein